LIVTVTISDFVGDIDGDGDMDGDIDGELFEPASVLSDAAGVCGAASGGSSDAAQPDATMSAPAASADAR
jgi:hypothetical protein